MRWLESLYQAGNIIHKGNCHLWRHTHSGSDVEFEVVLWKGVLRVQTSKVWIRAHCVVYFLHTGRVALRKNHEDISHLCHRKDCVKPEHLVLELHQVNYARTTCVRRRMCMGLLDAYTESLTALFERGQPKKIYRYGICLYISSCM